MDRFPAQAKASFSVTFRESIVRRTPSPDPSCEETQRPLRARFEASGNNSPASAPVRKKPEMPDGSTCHATPRAATETRARQALPARQDRHGSACSCVGSRFRQSSRGRRQLPSAGARSRTCPPNWGALQGSYHRTGRFTYTGARIRPTIVDKHAARNSGATPSAIHQSPLPCVQPIDKFTALYDDIG